MRHLQFLSGHQVTRAPDAAHTAPPSFPVPLLATALANGCWPWQVPTRRNRPTRRTPSGPAGTGRAVPETGRRRTSAAESGTSSVQVKRCGGADAGGGRWGHVEVALASKGLGVILPIWMGAREVVLVLGVKKRPRSTRLLLRGTYGTGLWN
jgi:hypothetical protein